MTLDTALRVACILGCACVLSVVPLSASADVSVAAPATQAAIVAAVEKQRKTYGGKTPVPGVLIGVWDGPAEATCTASATRTSRRTGP